MDEKIYLSPPNIDYKVYNNIKTALDSGWISPVGSFIDDFTNKLNSYFNKKILLTNSGTSSLHLALKIVNIQKDDYVLCSNFTFAASAFPILYEKAIPIFIGSEEQTWNLSPDYLNLAIEQLNKKKIKPKALILAHIYGMPAQLDEIIKICNLNKIVLIEDSAEAFGSKYNDQPLGALGKIGILSFNGNKIITCSTGGAIILSDIESLEYAKKLSNQSKENTDYYLHNELGYNYALSNVLAAIGDSQIEKLNLKVNKRREIYKHYFKFLKEKFDIQHQYESYKSFSNRWLSSFIFPTNINHKIKNSLAFNNIETRYLWNPLHNQKAFANSLYFGNKILDNFLFENGLSLPSGDNLTLDNLEKIINIIKKL